MWPIKNVNEELLWDRLAVLLADVSLACGCDKCKADIVAYALNELKPNYATSQKGIELIKRNVIDLQLHVDMVSALSRGISIVSSNPRHIIDNKCTG
ncbi:MAG: late competence development ComFB family protein [Firmicutes bacterium]|nr:late competence development ComFB family protein [Bacillota bacterium]